MTPFFGSLFTRRGLQAMSGRDGSRLRRRRLREPMPLTAQRLEDRLAFAATPTVISTVTDDAGAVHGTIAIKGVTDDATPTLSGKALANSAITVFDGDKNVGTATADTKGAWKITTTALADGLHTLKAQAAPASGPAVLSSGYEITIDTVAPQAAVTAVPTAKTYTTGNKLSFTVTFDETVKVALGAGKPAAAPTLPVTIGSHVRQAVYASGSGSKTLVFNYTVAAGDSTAFNTPISLAAAMTVPAGASIRDTAGNDARPSFTSTPSLTGIFVDAAGPIATFGSLPAVRNNGVDSVSVSFDESATGVKLGSFKLTHDKTVVAIGTATLSGSGKDYTLAGLGGFTTKQGVYTLSLEASGITDAIGNKMSKAASVTWTTDTTPPAAPVIASVTDDEGDVVGKIAPNGETDDSTPTLHGTAEANSTVEVFEGIVSKGTTKADSKGAWSLTLPQVDDGPHTYAAKATDAVNNTGGLSHGVTFTVDAKRATPAVTGVPEKKTYPGLTHLKFTVTFSEPVNVKLGVVDNAPPTFTVTIQNTAVGNRIADAKYVSGSGTSNLVFDFETLPGDLADNTNPLVLGNSIILPEGAAIRNLGGKKTDLTFTSTPSLDGIYVDGRGPRVQFEYLGRRRDTPVLSIAVTFNEPVKSLRSDNERGDLTYRNLKLTRDGVEVSLTRATLSWNGNTLTIGNLGGITYQEGMYEFSVGGERKSGNYTYDVVDQVGNEMDEQLVRWTMLPIKK